MKIERTENGDLDFNTKNYSKLNKGLVIFPETLADVEKLEELEYFIKDFLEG
jgi:hypothetical protein